MTTLFKISTKEKFFEISLSTPVLAANMTEAAMKQLDACLVQAPKNIVLSMKGVVQIEEKFAEALAEKQSQFYDAESSFVVCEIAPTLEDALDEAGMLHVFNATPSLSEAWDMVQMEIIERELFDDYEENR